MEKIELKRLTLQYSGLFDFEGLLALLTDWSKNYGYLWHESDYKHKVPSPFGGEQELYWTIKKNVTPYIRFEIKLYMHVFDNREVEVEINGKKKRLTSARLYIWFDPSMSIDWQNRFKGGKFIAWLGQAYNKLMKKDIESIYGDQIWYRTLNLHALMKQFFDMQTKKYAYKGYLGED